MAFFYKNEHISCTNYAEGFSKIFSLMEISEGAVVERRHLDTTFLVIMLEGDIEVKFEIDKHFSPRPGYMFLLPKNEQVTTYAQKSSTLIIM